MFLHPLPCHCLRYQSISFVFLFVSRYIYADPLHCNMTYLFIRLLKDDLKEYTYAARLSGLVYGIASGMNAILVSKKRTQEEMKQLGSCWAWRKHLTSAFLNEMVNVYFSLHISRELKTMQDCILIMSDLFKIAVSCEHACGAIDAFWFTFLLACMIICKVLLLVSI